jgi:DNA invertase Pin-like site-specific DNA recombinase
MVFTVLGAVAELERSLIGERVRAGLQNAKAKGKHVGRPKLCLDASEIARLRAKGAVLANDQSKARGRGEGTVRRFALASAKRN